MMRPQTSSTCTWAQMFDPSPAYKTRLCSRARRTRFGKGDEMVLRGPDPRPKMTPGQIIEPTSSPARSALTTSRSIRRCSALSGMDLIWSASMSSYRGTSSNLPVGPDSISCVPETWTRTPPGTPGLLLRAARPLLTALVSPRSSDVAALMTASAPAQARSTASRSSCGACRCR